LRHSGSLATGDTGAAAVVVAESSAVVEVGHADVDELDVPSVPTRIASSSSSAASATTSANPPTPAAIATEIRRLGRARRIRDHTRFTRTLCHAIPHSSPR
jgi:hypothetical protein